MSTPPAKKQKLMEVILQKEKIEVQQASFDDKLEEFRASLARLSKEKLDAFMKELSSNNDKLEKEFISTHVDALKKKKKEYNELVMKTFFIQ